MKEMHKGYMLVAGPTSGKTFLLNQLKRSGITVTDTDVITEQLIPEYFKNKTWEMTGPVKVLLDKMRDIIIADELLQLGPKLVLTNLWSKPFMERLFPAVTSKKKASMYVFRANALEMTRLSKQRGSMLSTGLTSKWANSAERWAPEVFDHVLWLPENVFLADVVTVRGGVWALTDLGKRLIHLSRTEALKFKLDDESRKEASNA